MSVNLKKIASMVGPMLGLNSGKLNDAIDRASAMSGNVSSRSDALEVLRRNGIDSSFLSKVQGMVNGNPMAARIASMAGLDLSSLNRQLDDLKSNQRSTGRTMPTYEEPSDDRIAQMRKRLDKARK